MMTSIFPPWSRHAITSINLLTFTRSSIISMPIPPACSCAYSTSFFMCLGYRNFFLITAWILFCIVRIIVAFIFPKVVGYRICLTTTACNTCIHPPIVIFLDASELILLATLLYMLSWVLPSYIFACVTGVLPCAFYMLPRCLK